MSRDNDDYIREQEAAAAVARAQEAADIARRAQRRAQTAGGFTSAAELGRGLATQVLPGIAEGLPLPLPPDARRRVGEAVGHGVRDVGAAVTEAVVPGGMWAAENFYGYSPGAVGMAAIPFSDEALAGIEAATTDRDYSETAPEWAARRAEAEAANPVSTLAGYGAQGIVTAPLLPMAPATGAGVSPVRAGLRMVPRLAAEGALFGGITGADRSDASVAGALQGIDPESPIAPQLGAAGDAASRLALDTMRGAGTGAALNVALGVPLTMAGQALTNAIRPREVETMRGAFDDAIRNAPSVDESIRDIELSIPEGREGVLAGIDLAPGGGAADVSGAAARAAGMPEPEPLTFGSIVDEMFSANPDAERARAAGLLDRRQLRAAHNTMGLPGLSDRMDRYGILARGEIAPTPEVVARAERVRDIAGDAIGQIRQQMGGEYVDAATVADRLDEVARQYAQNPHADTAPIVAQLRADAQFIRDASQAGAMAPTTQVRAYEAAQRTYADDIAMVDSLMAARREAEASGNPRSVAMIDRMLADAQRRAGRSMSLPGATEPQAEPIGFVSWDQLQSMINAQRERIRGIVTGSTVDNPGLRAQAQRQAYRAINEARDEAVQGALGSDALGRYRLARDVYHTGSLIAPPDQLGTQIMRSPQITRLAGGGTGATIGATIGGSVAGAPGAVAGGAMGGVLGFGLGNRLRDYQHAIFAAINDPARGSLSEVATNSANAVLARIRGTAQGPAMTEPVRLLLSMQPDSVATGLRQLAQSDDRAVAQVAAQELTRLDVAQRMPQIVQQMGDRIASDPSFGGRLRPALEAAVRAGTLQATLARLARQEPEAVAAVVDEFADPQGRTDEEVAEQEMFAPTPTPGVDAGAPTRAEPQYDEDDPFAPRGSSFEDDAEDEDFR